MQESLTLAMTQKARELSSSGKRVYSFSAGEPDFDTPQVIKQAAIDAMNAGFTKYTAVGGIPDLTQAIADKLLRENALSYEKENIVVSNGAKHSLFNLFAVLLDAGDEVIIPTPTWVSYPEMAGFFGGKCVFVETKKENKFKLTAQELKAAITPRSKILMLNSPSNPTGAVYTKEEYEDLASVLADTNIIVFSDEIYEKLVYDVPFVSFASIKGMFERTVTINGFSKAVSMTGWRVGYFAAPNAQIAKAAVKLQGQSTSNINSIAQKAAIAALSSANADVENMRKIFWARRDLAFEMFSSIKEFDVIKPDGAFYIYVSCEKIEKNSMSFCMDLLEKKGVATVPGLGFAKDGYFRFSYATDENTIKTGISLIKDYISGK